MEPNTESPVPTPSTDRSDETTPAAPAAAPAPDAILAAKAEEISRLQERLLRLQAEFENYKKRMAREKVEYLKFATEGLLLAFLPVLDNLERAVTSARADAANREAIVDGIEMIARLFRTTFEKAGVKAMDAVGHPFDPALHQAVAQVECADEQDNIVLEEIQKGYLLEGRVLRAAMVKVSRAAAPAAEAGAIGEGARE
jgi:molecular chaperone GrpE